MPLLTHAAVGKYKPTHERREIPDTRAAGLRLIIQPKPSGAKSWAMRFRRLDGRTAKLTLGRVDLSDEENDEEPVLGGALTLRAARQLANKIDRERARGLDVIEEYKASRSRKKIESKDRAANTFGRLPAKPTMANERSSMREIPSRQGSGGRRRVGGGAGDLPGRPPRKACR